MITANAHNALYRSLPCSVLSIYPMAARATGAIVEVWIPDKPVLPHAPCSRVWAASAGPFRELTCGQQCPGRRAMQSNWDIAPA
jgi:hypothetical protein